MTAAAVDLRERIRDVPDFPKPGIVFKDITPLLLDPAAMDRAVRELAAWAREREVELVVAAELLVNENGIVTLQIEGSQPNATYYVKVEGTGTGGASLALRPERLVLTKTIAPAMDNYFPGTVEFISYLGSQVDLHVRLSPKERVIVQIQNRPEQPLPVIGEQVHIGWSKSTARVFQS